MNEEVIANVVTVFALIVGIIVALVIGYVSGYNDAKKQFRSK